MEVLLIVLLIFWDNYLLFFHYTNHKSNSTVIDTYCKALNAKETFHAHQVSTLVLYVLVKTASHLRYKILEARNRAALSCANTKGLHNDCNNISDRRKEFASWPGIATSIHP